MMRFIIPLLLCTAPLSAWVCTPELKGALYTLRQDTQAHALLQRADLLMGNIRIVWAPLGADMSNALWASKEQTIYVNSSNPRTAGSIVRSIVFELHNALSTEQFARFDAQVVAGLLSKEQYVYAIEFLEYENVLKTAKILDGAIEQGIFPEEARWDLPKNFEVHFAYQKEIGHSQHIATIYDALSRKTGSSSRAHAHLAHLSHRP